MKLIMKVKNGYLNIDNGIKICKKEEATMISMSELSSMKNIVYKEKPMIGIINTEIVK